VPGSAALHAVAEISVWFSSVVSVIRAFTNWFGKSAPSLLP